MDCGHLGVTDAVQVEQNQRPIDGRQFPYSRVQQFQSFALAVGGMGLGTMWGRQTAQQMLAEVGFSKIQIKRLAHDFQNDYYIVQK